MGATDLSVDDEHRWAVGGGVESMPVSGAQSVIARQTLGTAKKG
jgi:hypothetical protein